MDAGRFECPEIRVTKIISSLVASVQDPSLTFNVPLPRLPSQCIEAIPRTAIDAGH